MSSPQFPPPGQPQRPPASGFFDSLRRTGLVRTHERWVGGVAGGVARRLDVDPVLVRCAWLVLCVFTGLGLLLYGLGWALLPEESDGRIHAQQALSGDLSTGMSGAVFVIIAGLSSTDRGLVPLWWVGAWDGPVGGTVLDLLWTALILGGVLGGVQALRRSRQQHRARQQAWAPAAPGQPVAHAWQGQPWQDGPLQAPSTVQPWGAEPSQDDRARPVPTGGAPSGTGATALDRTTPEAPTWQALPADQAAPDDAGVFPPPAPQWPTMAGPSPSYPAPAPRPHRAHRPRRPGPGSRASLLVVGLGLLALAGCAVAVAAGTLQPLAAALLTTAVLVLALGLGVLGSGLRGRRGGWMSWVAWPVVLLLALPALGLGTLVPARTVNAPVRVGTLTIRPTAQALEEARTRAGRTAVLDLGTFAAADVVLDLRGLERTSTGLTLSVTVGTGALTVLSRQGQALEVSARTSLGDITGSLAEEWQVQGIQQSGTFFGPYTPYDVSGNPSPDVGLYAESPFRARARLTSPAAQAAAGPDVTVEATVGLGVLRIKEESTRVRWQGATYDGAWDFWAVDSWTDSHGSYHSGTELPVEGMSHRAVSSEAVTMCLSEVGPADEYVDFSSLDLPGVLTADEKRRVSACVDKVAEESRTAAPSASPSPTATASTGTDDGQ